MKLEYTPENDTLYIEFKKGKNVEGESINARTVAYFSEMNELIAIEIEHAKKAVDLKKLEVNGKVVVTKKLTPVLVRKKLTHKR